MERWAGSLMVVLLISANIFALLNYYRSSNPWVKSDLREGALQVAENLRAGDMVVHSSQFSYRPFQYYLGDRVIEGDVKQLEKLLHLFGVIGDGQLPSDASSFNRIWLVLYPDFKNLGDDQKIRAWMDQHHRFVRALHDSPTLFIGLYERQGKELKPVLE